MSERTMRETLELLVNKLRAEAGRHPSITSLELLALTDPIMEALARHAAEPPAFDAVAAVWEKAAQVADAYAAENQQMAADSIHFDPVLGAMRDKKVRDLTEAEERKSDEMQMNGLIHSSMFRAAQNIAAALRSRGSKES